MVAEGPKEELREKSEKDEGEVEGVPDLKPNEVPNQGMRRV